MAFTGSLSDNRVTLGLPPFIRQALYDDAKDAGMHQAEYHRHVLVQWYDLWREPRGKKPEQR